jgi:Protein of unknown function (DUF4231)
MDGVEQLHSKQLAFYEWSARGNHRMYVGMKMAVIMSAAAIPIVSLIVTSRMPAAVLGGVIAVFEGYLGLEKTHERWIKSRRAAERLRTEGLLWQTRSGEYADPETADKRLAQHVASVLEEDQSEFLATFGKKDTDLGK